MENAYDFTSIRVDYQKDENKMVWHCDDGYGYGSTSTYYSDSTTWLFQGKYNTTVQEWTDYIIPSPTSKGLTFRSLENNDCKLILENCTASPRPVHSDESSVRAAKDILQSFTATYKRPLKGTGISDVTLEPQKTYNLTSAYGCYKKAADGTDGTDNSVLYKTDLVDTGLGCRG